MYQPCPDGPPKHSKRAAWRRRAEFLTGIILFTLAIAFELMPPLRQSDRRLPPKSGDTLELAKNSRTTHELFQPDDLAAAHRCLPPLHRSILGLTLPNRSHYCSDGHGNVFYEPLLGCTLAPPQPYWVAGVLTTLKGYGIYLVLKTKIKNNDEYTPCDKFKATVFVLISCVITVVSVVMLFIKAWSFETESVWQHFQCFGIICTMAPWTANFLLIIVSAGIMSEVSLNKNIPEAASKVFAEKALGSQCSLLILMVPLVLFLGPFFITNLLLMLVCGCCFVPIFVGFAMVSVTYDQNTSQGDDVKRIEAYMNQAPLKAIPGALLCGQIVGVMGAASAYFYTQMGFFQSIMVAMSERRSDIYFDNLETGILAKFTWLSELINEIWP